MGKFYVVGTPIGNLEDISLRALRILKEVDLILCEDTRVTKKLLVRHLIKTPTESYHQWSRSGKIDRILDFLNAGKNLALVSDAGTPGISDPGERLIESIYAEFGEKVQVIPIPGPNAALSALSVSGFPADRFVFLGFLPHKKGRQTALREIVSTTETVVLYESPHRILKTLGVLAETLKPQRTVVVGREITKMFEEFKRGQPTEVYDYFLKHPEKTRGEFVVIVSKTQTRYNSD